MTIPLEVLASRFRPEFLFVQSLSYHGSEAVASCKAQACEYNKPLEHLTCFQTHVVAQELLELVASLPDLLNYKVSFNAGVTPTQFEAVLEETLRGYIIKVGNGCRVEVQVPHETKKSLPELTLSTPAIEIKTVQSLYTPEFRFIQKAYVDKQKGILQAKLDANACEYNHNGYLTPGQAIVSANQMMHLLYAQYRPDVALHLEDFRIVRQTSTFTSKESSHDMIGEVKYQRSVRGFERFSVSLPGFESDVLIVLPNVRASSLLTL